MRWIYAILIYGLLILGCALTLHFLKLGGVQEQLKSATEAVLEERLTSDFKFSASFTARKGHITGIATTEEGMLNAQETVSALAAEGLPPEAQTEYGFTELTQEWKVQPSFIAFAQGEVIALRADLAPSTLAILEKAIFDATGSLPDAPLDPEASSPEPKAVGDDNIAIPEWEDTFGPAVEYFFRNDRLREAELEVTATQEVRVIGVIETNEEAQTLKVIIADGFPSLENNIEHIVRVERQSPPYVIKEENGIITLEGVAPSTAIRDQIAAHLQSQLAPGQKLEAAIQVLPEAPHSDWIATKPTFFEPFLAKIKSPMIIIGPSEILLRGTAPTKASADELANFAQAQLSGYTVTSSLTYPDEADSP